MGTITPAATQQFPFWNPSDDGFKGFNADPSGASGGGVLVAGTAYLARLPIRTPTLVSNLWFCTASVGVGASTGSFVWIVSGSSGAVLCQSADCVTQFETAGWNAYPMTTPTIVGGGPVPWVYAVALSNLATTQVGILRMLNTTNNSPQNPVNVATDRWTSKATFGAAVGPVTLSGTVSTGFSNIVGWS